MLCLNNWLNFISFSPVAPSEIQIFVDKVAVQGSEVFLQRGGRVDLRCETKAEPKPSFSWMVPKLHKISAYGPSRISGIKWQHTLVIRSLNCLNSGDYKCFPRNVASERASSSVAIRVTGLFVIRIALANHEFNNTQAMIHLFHDCRRCNMFNSRVTLVVIQSP